MGGGRLAKVRTAALAGALVLLGAAAPARALDARLEGELEAVSAVGVRDAHFQSAELRIEPQLEVDFGGGVHLHALTRLRADAFDRLEPGDPHPIEVSPASRRRLIGDQADAELRELVLDVPLGPLHLALGKQQVVWGQSDGLKLLDVVDPQEFREFILPDFEDSRIPLWTLNAELTLGDLAIQALWVPDPSFHDIPPQDGVFGFTSPLLVPPPPPPGIPVEVRHLDRPGDPVSDSDAGLRISGVWHGLDLSLNYLYRYEDFPIFFRDLVFDPVTGPRAIVRPGYRRTHLVGGTFSTALGDFTARGEVAWSSDSYFNTTDLSDSDGVGHEDTLRYVLGLDWYGLRNTLVSAQVFQDYVLGDIPGLVRRQIETNVTLLVRRTFRNDEVTASAIWVHNIDRGDGMLRPSVSWDVRDDVAVWLGLDVFYGTRAGIFGEFGARDRVVLGFRWSPRAL